MGLEFPWTLTQLDCRDTEEFPLNLLLRFPKAKVLGVNITQMRGENKQILVANESIQVI